MAYLGGADRVDGSWELNILVTDLQVERTLRVNGDLHIGGVMVKLVDALDIAMDWSDHALWWPEKNRWLKRSRSTLDQYGVQADAKLHFTPMHKNLRVQLPDLQILDLRPDFSSEVFHSVQFLCKELGIRHPEEMSLMKKFDKEDLKKNIKETLNQKDKKKKKDSKLDDSLTVNGNGTLHHNSQNSLDRLSPYNRSPMGPSPSNTLQHMPGTPGTPGSPYNTLSPNGNLSMLNGTMSPGSMYSLSFESAMESALANSPPVTTKEAFQYLNRPKNLLEKARVNYAWLDSSRSLMEQGVRDNDFTLLKFKYYNFYDLNPKVVNKERKIDLLHSFFTPLSEILGEKRESRVRRKSNSAFVTSMDSDEPACPRSPIRYDAVRINQIYEQAKWAIISEELDCTEEEAMMFGALQVQVQLQSGSSSGNDTTDASMTQEGGDDIDAALSDLQESLEGSNLSSPGDITHIPELADYVKFLKPKKFTLKSYKRYWCSFRDTHVAFYRTKEDSNGAPINRINFKGCEAHPDVNLHHKKYGIKLYIPGPDGMEEIWLRFESEEQYCKWMAACKLASKGKTMADSSYETEVQSLMKLLSMQKTTSAPDNKIITPNQLDINPEDFVSPRHYKKVKAKQTVHRIMEAHSNVRDMGLVEAKLAYIRAWQALPEFGISYFVIKMLNGKKEEIVGIHPNKVIRMDMNSGDSLKTWRYDSLRSWHVNWEVRNVILDFEEGKVVFSSLSADCKVVHEFIGGYIFLSMRSQDKSQTLDVELFHKLTGGRS